MHAKIMTGNRRIRLRRDGSIDLDYYQARAIRRRMLVDRVILRRFFTAGRRTAANYATTIRNLVAPLSRNVRAQRAGAAAAFTLAVVTQVWAQASTHQHGANHMMVVPPELKWSDVPSLPPGAQIAIIEGPLNESKPFIARLRFPANYKIPSHSHPAIEHVTVLSGVFHMGVGDTVDMTKTRALPVGGVAIMPPGTNHFAWTAEETIVQLHGVGPWGITYVNAADDPRKK